MASSSSSVRWMASVSYLVLHWATSLLALDSALCSSALPSCSSSYCSRSRSQSWREDCRAWARAFLAYGIIVVINCKNIWPFSKLRYFHLNQHFPSSIIHMLPSQEGTLSCYCILAGGQPPAPVMNILITQSGSGSHHSPPTDLGPPKTLTI